MNYSNIVAIHQLWQWYVTEGPGDIRHAASWELCVAILNVLDAVRPRTIADTGSGLTSIIMQLWARQHEAHVIHLDDDSEWGKKTMAALEHHGLNPSLVFPWTPFSEPFDLIVHDLGTPPTRAASMANVCHWGRHVIADDMHFDEVRQAALATGRRFSELKFTRDGYGRWAALSSPQVIAP